MMATKDCRRFEVWTWTAKTSSRSTSTKTIWQKTNQAAVKKRTAPLKTSLWSATKRDSTIFNVLCSKTSMPRQVSESFIPAAATRRSDWARQSRDSDCSRFSRPKKLLRPHRQPLRRHLRQPHRRPRRRHLRQPHRRPRAAKLLRFCRFWPESRARLQSTRFCRSDVRTRPPKSSFRTACLWLNARSSCFSSSMPSCKRRQSKKAANTFCRLKMDSMTSRKRRQSKKAANTFCRLKMDSMTRRESTKAPNREVNDAGRMSDPREMATNSFRAAAHFRDRCNLFLFLTLNSLGFTYYINLFKRFYSK